MYFKEWPFQIIPERIPDVWADRKHLYKEMCDLFEGLHEKRKSVIACIWGYYGAGKSHTLLHFKNRLEKEGNLFVYSKIPKQIRCFLDLYRQAFASRLDVVLLSRIVNKTWRELMQNGTEDEAFQTIYNEVSDNWLDFTQAIVAMARATMSTRYLADPLFRLSISWLMGERLGKRDLMALSVMRNIENDQDGARAIEAIVRLFCYRKEGTARSSQVIWSLDDCHFFAKLKDAQRTVIQKGLRDAFDLCPSDLCLLMSFTSSEAQKIESMLIEDLQALIRRSPFQISELTKKEAIEFVFDLINNPRFGKEKRSQEYYPFTKEVLESTIESIHEVDYLTPRNLMIHLDALTKIGEKRMYPKPVSLDVVKRYFAGISPGRPSTETEEEEM